MVGLFPGLMFLTPLFIDKGYNSSLILIYYTPPWYMTIIIPLLVFVKKKFF